MRDHDPSSVVIDARFDGSRMTQLSLLDVGVLVLGAGVIGSWSGLFGALAWCGFALVIRYLVPRGGL